jgi:hypothetical protein
VVGVAAALAIGEVTTVTAVLVRSGMEAPEETGASNSMGAEAVVDITVVVAAEAAGVTAAVLTQGMAAVVVAGRHMQSRKRLM